MKALHNRYMAGHIGKSNMSEIFFDENLARIWQLCRFIDLIIIVFIVKFLCRSIYSHCSTAGHKFWVLSRPKAGCKHG